MSYTIVGVIGHIDHGKTSLVAALTGTDTDTHPEEKRRGITIDLGFASYTQGDHRFALIDAPGHQKYIGNLLAGVSAVDVGLLVVACDQGIQAQTLEHAAILQSLGVEKLIVAMSRVDLSDEKTRNELSEELDLFLADFGFHDIPKVAISSPSGEGIEQLKSLLVDFARVSQRSAPSIFRMPIDRVFTIEGRGCVVAGTLWSGTVSVGDHVQLSRTGQVVRVRELEVHGESVTESQVGFRTAMNLAGTSAVDIVRGDELVAEGTHRPMSRMVAEMRMFRDAGAMRLPSTVQVHTATTSCEARLAGNKQIEAGEQAVVVIDTDQPIIATYRQQCLFRRPYPVGSFAGGRVLGSVHASGGQTRRLLELGEKLVDGDAEARLAAWVEFHGEMQVDDEWFQLQLGVPPQSIDSLIKSGLDAGLFQRPLNNRWLISSAAIERIRRFVLKLLRHQAEATDDAWLVEESVMMRASSTGSPEIIRWVIDGLVQKGTLVRVNAMVAVASDQTTLSKKQKARMDQILAMYRESRKPPTLKEAASELSTTIENVASLIRFATGQKLLIDLGDGFFIADRMFRVLCRELSDLFDASSACSVADIRDRWQITRKHAIPLLEYCDRVGVTIRDGDHRKAGPVMNEWLLCEVPENRLAEKND